MTQYQQVLAAIRSLGGKGTPKEIYAKILETNSAWRTNTPLASVSMYLSTSENFKNDGGVWVLQNTNTQDGNQIISRKQSNKQTERGLYFITLSPYIKIPGAGFIFKIGQSGNVKERLKAYSASLPVDTIQVISYYPIPEPVNLEEAEKEVSGELKGNENLGEGIFEHKITVRPYFSNHQEEWLQTLDLKFSNEEDLNKLANIVDDIVKTTIETLTPKPTEDGTKE
jgi:hypothetical protein